MHLIEKGPSGRRRLRLAVVFLCLIQTVHAQYTGRFSVKIGANATTQVLSNIFRADTITRINNRVFVKDTVLVDGGRNDGRLGLSVMVYYERYISKRLDFVAGIGYRQKGFSSESRYDARTGLQVSRIPLGSGVEASRLDYITLDVLLKYKAALAGPLLPYFSLGNRLGVLAGMKMPFWNTRTGRYGGYTVLEFSPVLNTGVEIPLKTKMARGKTEANAIGNSKILVEFEYNPGIMNIHRHNTDTFAGTPYVVNYPGYPQPLPVNISRTARNLSLGLAVGITF